MSVNDPKQLLFSTREMENSFRRLVKTDEEVGGWLILRWMPSVGPLAALRYQDIRRHLGDWCFFIEHAVVVPNESRKAEVSWRAWDVEKAAAVADQTATLYRGLALHFHTHPSGIDELSEGDLAFAGAAGSKFSGTRKWIAVVGFDPRFTITPYEIEIDVNAPDKGCVTRGMFYSWRGQTLKALAGDGKR